MLIQIRNILPQLIDLLSVTCITTDLTSDECHLQSCAKTGGLFKDFKCALEDIVVHSLR